MNGNPNQEFFGELVAGDYFGELGVVYGEPKSMSAWATTNTHLIYLEKPAIDAIKHL
jgi:CRP-like cAMP-binding protein